MSKIRNPRRHDLWRAYQAVLNTLCICLLASTFFAVGLVKGPSAARADDSNESPHGALFHSKGWNRPAIYQRQPKPEAKKVKQAKKTKQAKPRIAQKSPAKRKLKKTAKLRKSTAGKRSSKLRSAARARLPKAKQHKRSAKRRIPKRVVKRREHNLKRTTKRARDTRAYAVKVASLGVDLLTVPRSVATKLGKRKRSVTGGSGRVTWAASSRCLPGRLRAAINHVARNYGRVRVNSTCRSRKHNRRVGGASRSWHLKSRAADIRVFGNIGKTARYLRRVVGGFKHYGGGLFHIDTGPRRSW